jgi:hypothetical protein
MTFFAAKGDANQDISVELCEKQGLKFVHAHHETSPVGMADGRRAFRQNRPCFHNARPRHCPLGAIGSSGAL